MLTFLHDKEHCRPWARPNLAPLLRAGELVGLSPEHDNRYPQDLGRPAAAHRHRLDAGAAGGPADRAAQARTALHTAITAPARLPHGRRITW